MVEEEEEEERNMREGRKEIDHLLSSKHMLII